METIHIQLDDFDYVAENNKKDFKNTTTLSRGRQGWVEAFKGSEILSLHDDGDGIILYIDGVRVGLDYSQALEVAIALIAHTKITDPRMGKVIMSKQVDILSF